MLRERNTPNGKEREFLNPKVVINHKLQFSSKSLGITLHIMNSTSLSITFNSILSSLKGTV